MKLRISRLSLCILVVLVLFIVTIPVNVNAQRKNHFAVGAELLYKGISSGSYGLTVGPIKIKENEEYNTTNYIFETSGFQDKGKSNVMALVGSSGYVSKIFIGGTAAGGLDTFNRTIIACVYSCGLSVDEGQWLLGHLKQTINTKDLEMYDGDVACSNGIKVILHISADKNNGRLSAQLYSS